MSRELFFFLLGLNVGVLLGISIRLVWLLRLAIKALDAEGKGE